MLRIYHRECWLLALSSTLSWRVLTLGESVDCHGVSTLSWRMLTLLENVNSIMENVDSHVHWQSGVMEESLRPSIGAASTNQTRSGVKVIIKWNTLSPQLPLGPGGCCYYLRQYQPLLARPVTCNSLQTAAQLSLSCFIWEMLRSDTTSTYSHPLQAWLGIPAGLRISFGSNRELPGGSQSKKTVTTKITRIYQLPKFIPAAGE